MSSGTNSVSSGGVLSTGSELTLVVTVTSGSTNLTIGRVNFCDAAATYCTDIHLLGTAQLTSAGTAALRFHPGVGSHSYKAVFVGTPNGTTPYAGSTSSTSMLTVTGSYTTKTTIAQTGSIGNYTLTATVTSIVNTSSLPAPTGSVFFLDTTTSNSVLGTASLGGATVGLGLLNSSTPKLAQEANAVAVADFNADGIPDLAVSDSNSGQVQLAIPWGTETEHLLPRRQVQPLDSLS
jgi:trimeric autotransporter adhesin